MTSTTKPALPREVWLLVFANVVVALGYGVVAPVLPQYARHFGVSISAATFVITAFAVMRLVGAPPSSIGKFGADTDNWEWPRHTGDFALFRVYANANNEPAAYSPDNVPYKPKHFLPISMDGVAPGDFTMVFGFPGRTNLYHCSTS